jgi:hypothetical protein
MGKQRQVRKASKRRVPAADASSQTAITTAEPTAGASDSAGAPDGGPLSAAALVARLDATILIIDNWIARHRLRFAGITTLGALMLGIGLGVAGCA